MDKQWTISFTGTPKGDTHNWIKAMQFVNSRVPRSEGPVFSRPQRVVKDAGSVTEYYPRAVVKVRNKDEATFHVDANDIELQEWLEAAKAYTLGIDADTL